MNKRYYMIILTTAVISVLVFIVYPSLKLSNYAKSISYQKDNPFNQLFQKKKAFATIVQDQSMIEPALVSIYSLNQSSSTSDIIVVLPDTLELPKNQIQQFEKLGAKVVKVRAMHTTSPLVVQLWALLEYQKIIYFTPEIVFKKEIDQLFSYPAGSALTANENAPMFILEPNPQIFERLLRDYRKTSHVFNLLDQTYFRPMIEQDVKQMITMYSGHMKPWNFYGYSDVDWKKHYDPVSFYKWRRLNIDMKHALNPTEGSTWKNAKRQQNVCDAFLEATFSNSNSFPIQDQFSVLISTYNPERIEHLSLLIQHLLKSSKIHTVFITWHNPALKVPSSLFNHISEQDRVVILSQTFDSLNNRFNPIPELQTEAAYIMDDDIFIDLEDLEFTFHAWQSRKDSIVGHFPRRHDYHPDTLQASYEINRDPPYSIILTKSMFIRSDYLFAYTCLLEPKLHQVIDDQLNCEDLGFAMMASGITSVAPTYVKTKNPIHDFGLSKGISTNSAHMPARRKCISDFITQFWHKRDPLVYAYGAVAPFARPQTTKGNWKVVEKVVKSEKST